MPPSEANLKAASRFLCVRRSMAALLEGRNALILGIANKWSLAYAIAQAFWREGATLALGYLGAKQKETIEELSQGQAVSALIPCDVTKEEELTALGEELARLGKPIHSVVHSLAFANREDLGRPFVETPREGFLLAQEVSAYSLVAIARATAPFLSTGGSITTLTYLGSTRVVSNYNVMGVAKASLEASVRYLASDLGPRGIRVNAISAGPVKTASARAVKDFSSILDVVAQRAPLRKNVEPAEVGDAAVFLASDLGRGVTGNILFVDSGMQIMAG
jgi:enoyl-[acyl-carrier protein] reductase I